MASSSSSFFAGDKNVIHLSPSSFTLAKGVCKLNRKECTAILFYAPWCGYCQRVKGTWVEFAKKMKGTGVKVCAMNCDEHSTFTSQVQDVMPSLIQGYPTMIVFKNGVPDRQIGLEDRRTVDGLREDCFDLCGIIPRR